MMNFQGSKGQYKIVQTEDGSPTLWSEHYQEHCHSTAGAYQETLCHYIEGTDVLSLLNERGEGRILEIGFGIGMSFLATKKELHSLQINHSTLKYISTEHDEKLIQWTIKEFAEDDHIGQLKTGHYFGIPCYECCHDFIHLVVLLGDARETLSSLSKKYPEKVDCIYQDAFSPKRNPELWSEEWFGLLATFARPGTKLSTYSSSRGVRSALHRAGFGVSEGPGFGPKRSSTRAVFKEKTSPQIARQIHSVPPGLTP